MALRAIQEMGYSMLSMLRSLKARYYNKVLLLKRLHYSIRVRGGVLACLGLLHKKYKEGLSIKSILQRTQQNLGLAHYISYPEWMKKYEELTPQDMASIRKQIQDMRNPPLISILMPVYNPDPKLLQKALDSIQKQIYPHWELCIADDVSPNPLIQKLLQKYAHDDSRIKIVFRKENGNICASSNSALELCTGEYTALMDHDDILPEMALYFVAMEILQHPDVMLIYSDEDKLSPTEERYGPYFKPEWNEPLLLAQNYISHLGVYKTALLREIGGFRVGYEGSQDHDLALRCVLKISPEQIRHIPRILYHWRQFEGSGSFSDKALERCEKVRRQCVADYLEKKGYKAFVTKGFAGYNKITYTMDEFPSVTCIIPARNHADLTRTCLDGLLHNTDYNPLEIILVDNGSTEADALKLCEEYEKHPAVRVIHWDKPFNYSEINNMAAREARGDILALLNNDIKIIHSDWLQRLVSHAIQPETGAVGPKLLYANDTIQHAGIVRCMEKICTYVSRGFSRETTVLFGQEQLSHWISIVSGACLVVRKELFFKVGGMDETSLKVAFNDVDFCLKLHEAGYHNIYAGDVELYHLESISRGIDDIPEKKARFEGEINTMRERWKEQFTWDPFYSPHYTRHTTNPFLLQPEELPYLPKDVVWKPWEV